MKNTFAVLTVLCSLSTFAGTCKTYQSETPAFDGGISSFGSSNSIEECLQEAQSHLGDTMYSNGVEKMIRYGKYEFENEEILATGNVTLK